MKFVFDFLINLLVIEYYLVMDANLRFFFGDLVYAIRESVSFAEPGNLKLKFYDDPKLLLKFFKAKFQKVMDKVVSLYNKIDSLQTDGFSSRFITLKEK